MIFDQLQNFDVEITAGQIMSRVLASRSDQDERTYSYKILVPKAITSSGYIDIEELPEEKLRTEADPSRITQEGDIVIKLTTPFDVAMVTSESVGCFVPSFCAIIKNSGQLDKNYLCAFLSSKDCKEKLKNQLTGAITSILSVGKIREIIVPKPDDDIQKQIGRDFRTAQEKKKILRRILELEDLKNDIIFQEMTNDKH